MTIIFVVICFFVVGFVALYSFNRAFKTYVGESWPSILTNFVLVLVGAGIAIWGVNWAFQRETDRNFYDEISVFKNSYSAVIIETADTLTDAESLKKEVDAHHFSARRFNTDITMSVLQNPLLYKFSGNEYVFALSAYSQKAREANQILEHVKADFLGDGTIMDKNIEKVRRIMNKLIYYTQILQCQSQLYDYAYGFSIVIKPPNQDLVMDWIKNPYAHTVDEIVREKARLDKKKDELHRGIWGVWKKIRQTNNPG